MKFTYDKDNDWWVAKSKKGSFHGYIIKWGCLLYVAKLWFNDSVMYTEEYTKLSSAKRGMIRALRKHRNFLMDAVTESFEFHWE